MNILFSIHSTSCNKLLGKTGRRISATLAMLLLAILPAMAQIVRVTGKVVNQAQKASLIGVSVIDTKQNRVVATTDADGRFAVNLYADTNLSFSLLGYKKFTTKLHGKTYIEVTLEEKAIDLGEATIKTERKTKEVSVEPTVIEVKGNYFHVTTRVRVPRQMFARNTRLVVQPVITDVNENQELLMKPLVFDGQEYNTTQDRMYDYDMESLDPLAKYTTVKSRSTREPKRKNDIIGYKDSIYVKNVKHDYACDVFMAIEDYNKIRYRDTTTIAKGTINPLRFLDYSLGAKEVTDSFYYPKAEMQLRDSKGEINLHFAIGKGKLDMTDSRNSSEIGKLNASLAEVAASKGASLRAFSITGTASPDGGYERNKKLASQRMNSALGYIMSAIDKNTRRNMDVRSNANVASWTEVAQLLRKDGHNEEADAIDDICHNSRSRDAQWKKIRKLPFYKTLLTNEYLPKLRKVEYQMNYSIYRFLTIDEIKELYAHDYKQLSRYEFFRLEREETNPELREKYCRQALELYPSFMMAANDLQVLLINKKTPNDELLQPFAGKDAPVEVNANQMIALLDAGRYGAADSLSVFVPTTPDTRLIKAVAGALNGDYEDNYKVIAHTGTRNEVLMLLAMKRNEEALKLSNTLPPNEALTHYIQAICLNRTERPDEAYDQLEIALKMDPSLKKIAQIDADVNNLLLDKAKNDK